MIEFENNIQLDNLCQIYDIHDEQDINVLAKYLMDCSNYNINGKDLIAQLGQLNIDLLEFLDSYKLINDSHVKFFLKTFNNIFIQNTTNTTEKIISTKCLFKIYCSQKLDKCPNLEILFRDGKNINKRLYLLINFFKFDTLSDEQLQQFNNYLGLYSLADEFDLSNSSATDDPIIFGEILSKHMFLTNISTFLNFWATYHEDYAFDLHLMQCLFRNITSEFDVVNIVFSVINQRRRPILDNPIQIKITIDEKYKLSECIIRIHNHLGKDYNIYELNNFIEDLGDRLKFFAIDIDTFVNFCNILNFNNPADLRLFSDIKNILLFCRNKKLECSIRDIFATKFLFEIKIQNEEYFVPPLNVPPITGIRQDIAEYINNSYRKLYDRMFNNAYVIGFTSPTRWPQSKELKFLNHIYNLYKLYNHSQLSLQNAADQEAFKIVNILKFIDLPDNYSNQEDIEHFIKNIENSLNVKKLRLLHIWKKLLTIESLQTQVQLPALTTQAIIHGLVAILPKDLITRIKHDCNIMLYKILESPNMSHEDIQSLENTFLISSISLVKNEQLNFFQNYKFVDNHRGIFILRELPDCCYDININSEEANYYYNRSEKILSLCIIGTGIAILLCNPLITLAIAAFTFLILCRTVINYRKSQNIDHDLLNILTTNEKYDQILDVLNSQLKSKTDDVITESLINNEHQDFEETNDNDLLIETAFLPELAEIAAQINTVDRTGHDKHPVTQAIGANSFWQTNPEQHAHSTNIMFYNAVNNQNEPQETKILEP